MFQGSRVSFGKQKSPLTFEDAVLSNSSSQICFCVCFFVCLFLSTVMSMSISQLSIGFSLVKSKDGPQS